MDKEMITTTSFQAGDEQRENTLRPQYLDDFIGQPAVKDNLKVFIEAAKLRHEPLDHVLFYGPPGLGKTTLAGIIANELGVEIKVTSGPAIGRAGDLAAILTNLNDHDVLFIDEIHRLNRSVEEVLYSAMEDYALDIVIGKGPSARSIRLDIARFTLIGATTRAGSLSAPLRDRFGVLAKFDLYRPEDLGSIIRRSAGLLGFQCEDDAVALLAQCSRGTPRVANRLLKRVRDFAQVQGKTTIDLEAARTGLDALGVDHLGLERLDREILRTIIERFGGGPVGIDTISASLGEEKVTIEDAREPYLIQSGLLYRTPKGRMVTRLGYEHMGIPYPYDGDLNRGIPEDEEESEEEEEPRRGRTDAQLKFL